MGKNEDEPSLANVNHVDTVRSSLPEVRFHVNLEIFGAEMALRCEQHLNVLRGSIEDRRELRRRHDCGLDISRTGYRLEWLGREICLCKKGEWVWAVAFVRDRVSRLEKKLAWRIIYYRTATVRREELLILAIYKSMVVRLPYRLQVWNAIGTTLHPT